MTTPETHAHPRFSPCALGAWGDPQPLRELGLQVEVRRFPDATRTAAEAAAAIGCDVSEIVKSLIFEAWGSPQAEGSGGGALVLMDGSSRVDVQLVRRELGASAVKRANADLVREATGYATGGVPPFGHRTRTRVPADRGVLDHSVVRAAAGTPHAVFPLDPKSLIAHAGATLVDVRERTA
ncbi:YbaK/EbsC family protein [Streptomyces sp. NPDC002133]|uniref:YbaK/EbsC family protein n=1 Tax=Streptomyces sp. NPDC002133 TaxID=3154409 RepID=UPI0033251858